MEKAQVQKTLKIVKDNSSKRNFKQSIDLIINLKDIDLKKQDNRVDVFAQLHFNKGSNIKVCGFVGPELIDQAKENFDTAVSVDEFSKYKDKKLLKKLAKEHSYFVAQANIMPQVATAFGRVLGPLGKMPSPKAGCVVPPNANLKALKEKLQKTVRIKVDTNPLFQAKVGTEEMDEEQVIDNILTLYNSLVHALTNDVHNIKESYLKLTMGKAFKMGEDFQAEESKPESKKEAPKKEEKKEGALKE
jgi:large subunit ribosomal protein L1